MMLSTVLLAAANALMSPPADTTTLTLAEAIAEARVSNYAVIAARADAGAAAGRAMAATQAFLPSVDVGLNGMRTTDPVAVFGLKLRQEAFEAGDLSLDALNRPRAYAGYGATVTARLPLLVPDALFGRSAAQRAAGAMSAVADRVVGVTTFQVVQAYGGALLAAGRVEVLDAALTAARSYVARAEALRDQGLVTGLDARVARVRAAEVESQRIGAAADARTALEHVKLLLGLEPGTTLRLSDSLPLAWTGNCGSSSACELEARADLKAAALGRRAAAAAVRSAWGSNLPSVALFGTMAHHARTAPWDPGSGDWTVGVVVNWNVLRGLGGAGAVREARARHAAATAQEEAARGQAALEATAASLRVEAARAQLDVAIAASGDADDALAQARLRYDQGISPISELLEVQASRTAARLTLLMARHDVLVAEAALDLAYGVFDK